MPAIALESDHILVDRDGSVVRIRLNRPDKKNAITLAMWGELTRLFNRFSQDSSIRGVIFGGAGGLFSAGADISEFDAVRATPELARAYDEGVDACADALNAMPQPTVAAISGVCAAGSLSIALACDFRIADRSSYFFLPPARMGIVYNIEKCRRLANIVGLSAAKKILFTGNRFGIDEALANGFVTEACEGGPFEAAGTFIATMTDCAPLAIAGIKAALEAIAVDQTRERAPLVDQWVRRANESEDTREAARAFREKRKPVFHGR